VTTEARFVEALALVAEIPRDSLTTIIGALEKAKAEAWSRLNSPLLVASNDAAPRWINVREAASLAGVSASLIYKNAATLPFCRRVGKKVQCDRSRVERWDGRTGLRAAA
jgi:predicted DNA-binding transcriptional regulator AlpA